MAFVALIRGRIAGAAGRIDEARAAFQEAATFFDEIGDSRFGLVGLSDLGHAVRRGGELDEALSILRRTLPEWEHSGNRGAIANQLEASGSSPSSVARRIGRPVSSALRRPCASWPARRCCRMSAPSSTLGSRGCVRRWTPDAFEVGLGGGADDVGRRRGWPSRSKVELGLAGKPASWYAGSMKITLDLDGDLYRAVKVEAARADRSVREVVAEALEGWLAAAEEAEDRASASEALAEYERTGGVPADQRSSTSRRRRGLPTAKAPTPTSRA